ncbi:hypothetical protein RHMOL_Rhmol10G0009400 [Rhododendron molle]|uniref:Uncharacterized protein n=1 Tax=Rhododendron molle TaxID=49168 RepID=A0ACC0LXQ6_RHOML|nr:hypothetical protein RHMOL_Rhmol10G0009400 [Rhododendron molle]
MGACVSVHKDSKTDKLVIPEPIKEKPIVNGDRPIVEGGLKSQWSQSHPVTATVHSFGSKEEAFFDSQPWLESDCDDDFVSVNGDFTPSRGSTPVHQSFSARTLRVDAALFDDKTPSSKPEPSPTSKKKLAELFRDSIRNKQDINDQTISGNQNGVNGKVEDKVTTLGLPPRPANGIPFVSGADSASSSERTPYSDYTSEKEKQPIKSVQCCLPRMLSTRSYRERRKKMSPTPSLG